MDDVIEFLRSLVDAEYRARRANFGEPDDDKFLTLVRAWDAMFGGDLRSGLSRPHDEPAAKYTSEKNVAAAGRQRARSIFAVARYKHGGTDLYRAWMGDTELRRGVEGIPENFYVARDGGALKVVALYMVCSKCFGAATLPDGETCPSCDGTGWVHRRGTEWGDLGPILELRKLQAPTDPRYQRAYEALAGAAE
jgi:hypothetical protein